MQRPASPDSRWLRPSLTAPLLLAWHFGVGIPLGLSLACAPDSSANESVIVRQNTEDEREDENDVPPMPGESRAELLYELPPPPGCGDFDQGADEACDDGNRDNGDGCSGNCLVVENGYSCEPGKLCVQVEVCGDALIIGNEGCDDGNDVAGDGCASNCQVENGFTCPEPGQACVSTAVCGDGFVALAEQCDDGNAVAGDGCSELCSLEQGWLCANAGVRCVPQCGDGLLRGAETCDDANLVPGDGCSAACRLEPGFECDAPGIACRLTECRDGLREGSEQCDDGNAVPYDGCTAACTNEPRCGLVGGTYSCAAVCGDGMKFPEEDCDDGNTVPDDGCSPDCILEPGYACTNQAADLGDALALPIIYRDFPTTHPHFEVDPGPGFLTRNMVLAQLGPNGKPVYNPDFSFDPDGDGAVTARAWTLDGRKPANLADAPPLADVAQISARFDEWFADVPGENQTLIDVLSLALQGDGSFQFSATGATQFFPIDGLGFGNEGNPNNFHFTSEVRQWFEFQGGELLQFTGDDDVWVFINGQLTVDLGGIHGEISGSILLSEDGTGSTLSIQETPGGEPVVSQIDVPVSANVNEIVVFQAERHVTQSNYTLTLRGFNAPVTSCSSVCGDGILTPDETCDDGAANGSGYGFCSDTCTPGPRCGDATVNGPEECDNGFNRDAYQTSDAACAPGCVRPSFCGDSVIDAAFGEQCDDGVNDGSYGGCTEQCLLGPRCGDGVINGQESCDDGNRRNTDGCNINCFIERDPL